MPSVSCVKEPLRPWLNFVFPKTVLVADACPRLSAVEAPPARLIVVAVSFNRLNVAAVVVISPPLTARSPAIVSVSVVLL